MKKLVFALAILFPAFADATEAPKVSVEVIKKTDTTVTGQRIASPADPTVLVSMAMFPPGSRLPVHKHMYPHYGYVLEGTLTVVNDQTGKSFDLKQGEFLIEMNDTWHHGQNNGTVPVKLLVIDHLPPGATSNTVPKTSAAQ